MLESNFTRGQISFEQAEGVEPLPAQLGLKQISQVLRARLWQIFLIHVDDEMGAIGLRTNLGPIWRTLFKDYCVSKLGMFSDEVGDRRTDFIDRLKPSFQQGQYSEVLGTVEWFVRRASESSLRKLVQSVLEEEYCAYRLIDLSIVPIATAEEGRVFVTALSDLSRPQLGGARAHLLQAGSMLTAGKFADSVRDSIHAVESVARTLTGESSLAKSLQELSKGHPLHPALKNGFNNIYGYTSDANGIRHPMIGDDGPAVGEAEAIFMLGACAAFVTFLVSLRSYT